MGSVRKVVPIRFPTTFVVAPEHDSVLKFVNISEKLRPVQRTQENYTDRQMHRLPQTHFLIGIIQSGSTSSPSHPHKLNKALSQKLRKGYFLTKQSTWKLFSLPRNK